MPFKNTYKKPTSLTEFLLEKDSQSPDSTSSLTLLLTQIEYAAKIIGSHVRKAGLVNILGKTGNRNASHDEVKKIDIFTNELLIDVLSQTAQVSFIGSEELEKPRYIKQNAPYMVFFDPLDGSSNIDINGSVGTIFSIYRTATHPLQPGNKQIAAGYILYGPSDMFVYTSRLGVHGFTLDPSIGSFLLSHPDIRIPEKGSLYAINEANAPYWDEETTTYIYALKQKGTYTSRYTGAMVADVHRTLLKGGIFLYPADKKNTSGKLRLLYEVNPMSLLIQQAGGTCISESTNPLDIDPVSYHQRVPLVLGSNKNVQDYTHPTKTV